MREQGAGLSYKPTLEYFDASWRFGVRSFVDHHDYWSCDCDFEMRLHNNLPLGKVLVGLHDVKVFSLPPCDHPGMLEPVLGG